ncbi:hypothetical protein [Methylosinus sp. PW1]|uniref:hypothetical protein n=1 Tax=Methylosinus sp. PW1 TaxID=107636 RepID=UPI0012EC2C90|nr:hypothetical protein [Methylosinus sp. PW1]
MRRLLTKTPPNASPMRKGEMPRPPEKDARSERAHDEAVIALRQYEPLALEMLKLFSLLSVHADLALADVEAADKDRINPHTASAVRHRESALAEHKQSHVEGVAKHIAEALHELELASG